MTNLLPNFVDNLATGIHKIKYKYGHDPKSREMLGFKYKGCVCCLEFTNVNLR